MAQTFSVALQTATLEDGTILTFGVDDADYAICTLEIDGKVMARFQRNGEMTEMRNLSDLPPPEGEEGEASETAKAKEKS